MSGTVPIQAIEEALEPYQDCRVRAHKHDLIDMLVRIARRPQVVDLLVE